MLPLFKDNTQLVLGHLLSRSLEPAGQKENTGNPEKEMKFKKDPFSYICNIEEILVGIKHFQIVCVKNIILLNIFLVRLASRFLILFLNQNFFTRVLFSPVSSVYWQ